MGYKPESFTLSQSYTHEGVLAGRGMGRGPLALYMIGSLCTARAARTVCGSALTALRHHDRSRTLLS